MCLNFTPAQWVHPGTETGSLRRSVEAAKTRTRLFACEFHPAPVLLNPGADSRLVEAQSSMRHVLSEDRTKGRDAGPQKSCCRESRCAEFVNIGVLFLRSLGSGQTPR